MRSDVDLGPMLANVRDYWLGWGAQKREVEPSAVFRSGVHHPLFNGVRQSVAGDSWTRIAGEMAGVPWMWWLGEDSPPRLADSLGEQGAVPVGTLPIWAADVGSVPSPDPLPGLAVGEVTGPEDIERWVRMWTPASELPADLAPILSRLEQARPLPSDGGYVRLAGWCDGELVASAVLLAAHGVAGLFVVSTAPSHRRRGIGRAVTTAALAAAAERGLRVAVLNPTEQGAPLYRRMGFEQVSQYRLFVPGPT